MRKRTIYFVDIVCCLIAVGMACVLSGCGDSSVIRAENIEKPAQNVLKEAEPVKVKNELTYRSYKEADIFMGDWSAQVETDYGDFLQNSVQIIGLGDGMYKLNLLEEFDSRAEPVSVLDAKLNGNQVSFTGNGLQWTGTGKGVVEGDLFTGRFEGTDSGKFKMKRIERLSPTLGTTPPVQAVVLFDGDDLDQWQRIDRNAAQWRLVDGSMEVKGGSIITKKQFKDIKRLHIEFRTPYMPKARGQGRGNSGVYIVGRYEVQVLDSYGLEGLDNECGGIYKVGAPLVNMCAPPMQWQTYDISFKAPRFDESGNKLSNAFLTVIQNGVTIHENLEIPGPTGGAASSDENQPGGIYLQDHGNPVQYRNIWVVE